MFLLMDPISSKIMSNMLKFNDLGKNIIKEINLRFKKKINILILEFLIKAPLTH